MPMSDRTSIDATPVLECRNLCISYFTRSGEIPAVVDFNLRLMPGEAHGLVGESGCGKSTIALAVMQYLGRNGRITGGQILFEGRDMLTMSKEELRQIRGSRIAMVYQEPMASLNPSMTIGAQLAEVPLYHEGVTRTEAMARALDMLHRVKLPDCERIMQAYPHQISGGQQQRVVIAMALLSQPKILLLDEPTTALDVTVEAGIVELIREIAALYGTALLYVSHNLGLIRETCESLTVMYSGEAVETGPVAEVFSEMRHPYTRGLFGSIPVPGADKNSRPLRAIPGQLPPPQNRPRGCFFSPRCAFARPGLCDQAPVPMTHAGAGSVRCLREGSIDWQEGMPAANPARPAEIGEVMVDVRDLSKSYHEVRANRNLSFDARQGETVAIVGESGCGKSTFARVLMGLEQASDGSLRVAGNEMSRLPVQKRGRDVIRNLQMVFQNPFDTLNPSHTIGSQIARVIRKFGVETDEARVQARVLELLDLVKLPRDFANRRPRQLSGGQKQRIGIARAFAGNPSVVVADEPVSALDVSVQAAVADLLMSIQREKQTTLIFISHDLAVVRYLADRIVVMYLGQIVEQGRADEVFAPPYHPYTEALLSAVPVADLRVRKRKVIVSGDLPSPKNPPAGCPFSTRCSHAIEGVCATKAPPLHRFSDSHSLACHLPAATLQAMEPVISLITETPAAGDAA